MKAYIMGNYTEKAFQGFMKDPTSDRKAVVEQLTKAVGGKIHCMDIVRGSYDFIVLVELESFDDFAAIKLVVESSGAVKNMTILESIDFTKATTKASKIGYKPPGQKKIYYFLSLSTTRQISDLVRNLRPVPLSNENMPPIPLTASIVRSVCFHFSYWSPFI